MQLYFKRWARTTAVLLMVLGFVTTVEIFTPSASAQNAVTAQLSGVVTDSTGAVVQNATVTIVDTVTGDTRVLTTNAEGRYVSPLMQPGKITVSASAPGLQSNASSVQLLVGQQSVVNLTVSLSGSKQTVTVSANNAQLMDTQSSTLTTTFTTQQFQDLPMPGGDITTIAYTIPGVVVNAGGGGGNFSSDGLPGNSNLFVVNGADLNSLFNNLNYSGSSNLTIGAQEIAQSSVVQNGYSVEYGRQAGIIESYVTKSGANRIHGLLQYNYNSDGLNANDFFNNQNGTPRQKAVSNQYAAQIGGPAIKDKLFWFVDNEGIRYILPVTAFVNFPTAQLQNTILNTVPGGSAGQSALLYGQMFKLLQTAPTYATAHPVTNGSGSLQDANNKLGCGTLAGTPVYGQPNTYFGAVPTGSTGTAISCVNTVETGATNLNREWFLAGRVDYNISDKQKVFLRITYDTGEQPTFTSVINPVLGARSIQPNYSGQLNHTYIFTPNLTNQFILSGHYISSLFGPASISQTLAASPTLLLEAVDGGTNSQTGFGQAGNTGFRWTNYPQGRKATQYQFVDDLSWLKGNHVFKFGFNLKRGDLTDVGNQINTIGGYYNFGDAADFASGALPGGAHSNYNQAFDTVRVAYTALYNLGIYAQDEWKATPRLVVDYGIRVDRNGNPLCNNNCFSEYRGGFPSSSATLSTPYNATLATGIGHAFPSIQNAVVQPRAGFNWDITGQGKSVLRGGVGLFADEFPALAIVSEYGTFPNVFAPVVFGGVVGQSAGSSAAAAAASNTAITTGFNQGQNANQMAASLPTGVHFTPPSYYTTPQKFLNPQYLEWSLQMQRQIAQSDAVILTYAGNHGSNLMIQNNHLNQNLGGDAFLPKSGYASFGGLPAAPPDPRFASVTKITNNAISGYNGVSITYKHIDRRGITADMSYTWSHALDDVSNGGDGKQPFNSGAVISQITPASPSALMYSNSDYDIRNNFVMDFTYVEPNHFANKLVQLAAGGWTMAGKAYWRSGEPFSVFNIKAQNALNNGTGGVQVLADVLNNSFNHVCTSYSQRCFQTPGIFNGTASQSNFGNVPRNAFYGPHYADVDVSVFKDLVQKSAMQFQVGAQAYNVLNHVNFGQPQNNASQPGNLGKISSDIGAPTSPYGASQGSAVSGRVLVVQGRLTF